MARRVLTDRVVRQAKEPGVLIDGDGLRLKISRGRTGALRKSWILRFTIAGGRTREMGLGSLEVVSLAEARKKADELRAQARAGADPLYARRMQEVEAAAEAAAEAARRVTFRTCAEAYIAAHAPSWKNRKHAGQWPATLATYVYPVFGDAAVSDVDQMMVMKVLDPIWATKTETASRVRGRIEAVLDWAAVRGFRRGENPARWRGHLEKALPARAKVQRVQHLAAMPIDAMPAFMAALRTRSGAGAQCLAFLILTATRYNEAAGARWGEIDLEKRVWTIPAERMKAGREHRVPLSDPALAILHSRAKFRSSGGPEALVFESDLRPGAKLSDMTLTAALRRLGREETVHGFRSTFRDWAAERTNIPREIAEAALAHANADKVEAAYRRSDLFEKRSELMTAWARFCGDARYQGA